MNEYDQEMQYMADRLQRLEDALHAERLRSIGLEASLRELLQAGQLAVGTWNEEMRSGEQFNVLMGCTISDLEVRNAGARAALAAYGRNNPYGTELGE